MNQVQKKFVLIGIAVMVLMCLVPPWTKTFHYKDAHMEWPADYALIFAPPEVEALETVAMDFGRLFVQCAAVGLVIGGGVFHFREAGQNRNEKASRKDA
jgi:hypothetical protein